MPPPAPWLSRSVTNGVLARKVSSRASPCGVSTLRVALMAASSPGHDRSSGSTSSGPLFFTSLTASETG